MRPSTRGTLGSGAWRSNESGSCPGDVARSYYPRPRGKTGPSYHPSLTTILITKSNNRHKIVQKNTFLLREITQIIAYNFEIS